MSLAQYNKKRDFEKTSEPKGKPKNSKQKKFVVQYHEARAKHYDFRLQHKGELLSWAVPKGLSTNPTQKRLAVMVENHPLDYASFEGIIPKGNYGAGTVEIFDEGTYSSNDIEAGLKKGHIKFTLNGKKLVGEWSLVKIDEKNWLIIKSDDKFANANVSTLAKKQTNPFKSCSCQLAVLTDKIPTGKNWIFEIKYDGYRILSFVEKGKAKLFSRNGNDYTQKFEQIAKSLSLLSKKPMVLDGEVVCFDDNGKSDFSLLQNNIKKGLGGFVYVVFDILAFDGEDLRTKPLKHRKQVLEKVVTNQKNIIVSSYVVGKGKQCFNLAKKLNLEGIVAKKLDSEYLGKRDESWLKIKCYKRQEFVIGGFTTTDKNKQLSAILVGYYNKNKLIFVGKVGTGFSQEQRELLSKQFKKIKTDKCYFENCPIKNVIWIEPKLVAEVQYAELTNENLLRQPSFVGLRDDKNPKQVKLEETDENS